MADGLRRLDGVANVEVDLQANVCTVTPTPDRLPDLAGFPTAVHAAGFRPARMWVQVLGQSRDGAGNGRVFTIAGTDVQLPLVGVHANEQALQALVVFRGDVVELLDARAEVRRP